MNPDNVTTPPFRRRGLALELKLPLAVIGLLAALLLLYVWIAYHNVSSSGALAASEHEARLAGELARVSAGAVTLRAAAVARIANLPQVKAALRGGAVPPAESALSMLRILPDTALAFVLLDSARRPLEFNGAVPPPELVRRLDSVLEQATRRDTLAANGPIFVYNDRAYFWTATTVHEGERTIGYLAQLRTFGAQTETSRALNRLIGEESAVIFANTQQPEGPWVTLQGQVVRSPTETRTQDGVTRYLRDGTWYIAGRDSVLGTPFSVIVETSVAHTRARASQFLRRTGWLGLLLLLAGALIAWIVSRRYTRPIRELNEATAAFAAREFDRRVRVERTDELGELGHAFNHMADKIQHLVHESEASKADALLANRVKSDFLANMSHEIRTPINAMLGYTDLLELGVDGPLTDAQRAHLERVRVSGQHLTTLIDDLLDFTRLETARLSVQPRVAPAAEAVKTALTVVDPQASAKPVTLCGSVAPDTQYVGDPKRVEQILVNLLGNAIKFTPAGGQVRLDCRTVSANGQGAHTEFVVEDTGIGIAADRLETIFQPFVQVHGGYTRPHGGSGLGLTISSRLAELMGGTISVQSQEGVGSRFTLSLPAPLERPATT